jgi:glycine cleavage system H protein
MPKSGRSPGGKIFRIPLSRRQFIQRLVGWGGAVIGGAAISSSCKQDITSVSTEWKSPSPASGEFTNTSQTVPPATTPSFSSTAFSTVPSPTAGTGIYVPYKAPVTGPTVIKIPETECTVATDRVYSIDHVWVKTIEQDLVVMGVTPSFVKLIYPFRLSLFEAGKDIPQNDTFGLIEGYKTTADLITPVAGKIMETNQYLIAQGKSDTIPLLDSGPFVGGWMVVMRLAKPEELKILISPQAYADLILKMR